MNENIHKVYTSFEQVQRFVRFAWKYRTDFLEFAELRQFLEYTPEELHAFLIMQYTREEGEQTIRPKFYYQLFLAGHPSGDCDDATIFTLSLLFAAGIPANKILVCEAKEESTDENYCHIFAGYINQKGKTIFIDNLPGTPPNIHTYAKNCLKITKAESYLK